MNKLDIDAIMERFTAGDYNTHNGRVLLKLDIQDVIVTENRKIRADLEDCIDTQEKVKSLFGDILEGQR